MELQTLQIYEQLFEDLLVTLQDQLGALSTYVEDICGNTMYIVHNIVFMLIKRKILFMKEIKNRCHSK